MAKILCTRALPDDLLQDLRKRYGSFEILCRNEETPMHGKELLNWAAIEKPDALVVTLTELCTRRMIEALPGSVKAISTISVGTDNIDTEACQQWGIKVFRVPDVLTEATADLTWALILAASRRLGEADRLCREKKFDGWRLNLLLGKELMGSTLGIIGFGRIGRAVAHRAKGFGVKVSYVSRSEVSLQDRAGALPASLEELCASSDILSLHCPLTAETRHLLNEKRLRSCRKDAVLVNVSRGPLIDEEALVRCLDDDHFSGVALDVYEKEPDIHPGLLKHPRVFLTPHIGSATKSTRWKMMWHALQSVLEMMK